VDDQTKDNATRLGAIGDMNFAVEKKRIADDLLVIGGDNLFNGSLKNFLRFVNLKKRYPVIGAYDIGSRNEASNYGVIRLDAKKRIVDFQEKPSAPRSSLIAMCLYYFPKEKIGLIKGYINSKMGKKDAMGFYIDWLSKRVAVYGFVFSGEWFDIGDRKFYNTAKESFVK
jgi:glucose-1-phosphate thymidylyltransferase